MSSTVGQVDAVVVGAGHNGLVAANLLADAGLSVLVLEANATVGGAVRSDESVAPGFVTDLYSAFYPLAAASPVIKSLELNRWGLTWSHAPGVLAHVFPDDRSVLLSRDRAVTAESVSQFSAADGQQWISLLEQYERIADPMLGAVLQPFPPVRSALSLLKRLGTADALRFARFAVTPVRQFAAEQFHGPGAGILFAGNALHTDLGPDNAGSALYGWLLCMLGQTVGFPVPVGGSGRLSGALSARAQSTGVEVRTGCAVEEILVHDGQVTGVRTVDGDTVATTTVLADVGALALFRDLVGARHLPARMVRDLAHFQWDAPTLKLNWALREPVPWTAAEARGAGTVHLGVDLDGLTRYSADLNTRTIPTQPFLLFGQMATADATRAPAGAESAWAYTHLPPGRTLTDDEVAEHAERVQATVERHAPGFGDRVIARTVQGPRELEATDANLVFGAVGGGTSSIHQQLIFRPVPGLGRPETPIDGLYLASAAAHPGGGVHGAPGANAAHAALLRAGRLGGARRKVVDGLFRRIYAQK
jgi:phytoene dehydrogenase-like protein